MVVFKSELFIATIFTISDHHVFTLRKNWQVISVYQISFTTTPRVLTVISFLFHWEIGIVYTALKCIM